MKKFKFKNIKLNANFFDDTNLKSNEIKTLFDLHNQHCFIPILEECEVICIATLLQSECKRKMAKGIYLSQNVFIHPYRPYVLHNATTLGFTLSATKNIANRMLELFIEWLPTNYNEISEKSYKRH